MWDLPGFYSRWSLTLKPKLKGWSKGGREFGVIHKQESVNFVA